MAQKVITTLVDDLNGEPIEQGEGETIKFSVNGKDYEIDLSDDNAGKFHDALKPYVDAARSASSSSRRSSGTSAAKGDKQELAAARSWLKENGHPVAERGRISGALLDLYRKNK